MIKHSDVYRENRDFLSVLGTRHSLIVMSEKTVMIGCMLKSLDWWMENGEVVGRREGYSFDQIEEYRQHLEYSRKWLSRNKKNEHKAKEIEK